MEAVIKVPACMSTRNNPMVLNTCLSCLQTTCYPADHYFHIHLGRPRGYSHPGACRTWSLKEPWTPYVPYRAEVCLKLQSLVRGKPAEARELQAAAAQQGAEKGNRKCLTCCSRSTTATRRMDFKQGQCLCVGVMMAGLRAQVDLYMVAKIHRQISRVGR